MVAAKVKISITYALGSDERVFGTFFLGGSGGGGTWGLFLTSSLRRKGKV